MNIEENKVDAQGNIRKTDVVGSADIDEDLFDNDDAETAYRDCPKCGRDYDHIDYEYQNCKKCGWDAEKETWGKKIEPTEENYINGDADILTGRWL